MAAEVKPEVALEAGNMETLFLLPDSAGVLRLLSERGGVTFMPGDYGRRLKFEHSQGAEGRELVENCPLCPQQQQQPEGTIQYTYLKMMIIG